MSTRHTQQGHSLIELCIVGLVTAILLGQALPALQKMTQKQRLQGTAQALMTDLQYARSLAVARSSAVHMRFSSHPKGSCYILYSGSSSQCKCDDAGAAVCSNPAELIKVQWLPSDQAISLRANVNSMSFQARQGAVTSTGSIELNAGSSMSIKQIVSIAGRVRTCSPNGSVGSIPACVG